MTLILVPLCVCGQEAYKPRRGDIIFQVAGGSEFSSAIADATDHGGRLRLCHVAIVDLDSAGTPWVIEASEKRGVSMTRLEDFISGSVKIGGKPGVYVKRLKAGFPVEKGVERAKSFIGQPYDWAYLPDNGKIYCSELVYESFLDNEGRHIFHARPMNFKDREGRMPRFWQELFAKMGMEVPQGVAGTNPNDMFGEEVLEDVYKFF